MKWGISLFPAALLVLALCFNGFARDLPARSVPVPDDVSPALKQAIEADASAIPWQLEPKDAAAWKDLVQKAAAATAEKVPGLLRHLEIKCEKSVLGGVPVFLLEPPTLPDAHADKVLLYFHGGGYVFNPGVAGLPEGIYMAAIGKFKVVAVDYRLAPEFPYPAALDDAVAVYKALLKSYPAKNIGVFGSSTGGGMTLALCLRAREEGLPMPGAIAPGTPWSDLSKTGDSYFVNAHVDDVLVRYEGLLEGMAKAYAGDRDLNEPLLSPVYGDLKGFPPAILGTGTRDLFLSNTVRTHRKLREAGVPADLLVLEGLSHWQYVQLPPEAPETQFYFSEVAKFFEKHLGK
ncbi:MAG: alpha/beta hydrolase [Desulfovibrio sp.]|nr:alpha/beta hydrolase [Desulfovibrio sp.]